MGLLQLGTPLGWDKAKDAAGQVREWGIEQLLTIWRKNKDKERAMLLWGDEIEYLVVELDQEQQKARLSLSQAEVLQALSEDKELQKHGPIVPDYQGGEVVKNQATLPTFHPEFGRFMLEATPGKPWSIDFKDLLEVEEDMKLRRVIAKQHMGKGQYPVTLTTFPRLGTKDDFITPYYPPSGPALRSQFVPDEIANPHIRFPTLAANIRSRRGRKVELNVPVFHDDKTQWPFHDPTVNYHMHNWPEDDDVRNGAAKENCVYMDAMAFGMGSCCLQITFQAKNINEGRVLYDQLSPLGPILLALTAATPIYKGFLVDTDVRWNQISRAVDDRTREELGEVPLKNDRWQIPKSRYASNSTYIAQDSRLRPEYLDPNLVIDQKLKQRLLDGGMDDMLATHFAHLFIRDPLVIFAEDLKELDVNGSNHFENLQSTNWQHMRFKPPPPDNPNIGWRVEFRSMEIQMTDFENAAFSIFIVLLSRVILSFDLNLYIPIPRTTENMEVAHRREAVLNDKFWFRKNPFPRKTTPSPSPPLQPQHHDTNQTSSEKPTVNGFANSASGAHSSDLPPVDDEYCLMTVNEIINGPGSMAGDKGSQFPGLIPLVRHYLSSLNVSVTTRCQLERYLDLIAGRANGSLWTNSKWIRHFVREHPEYKHDSAVSEKVTYDLINTVVADIEQREDWSSKNGAGWEISRSLDQEPDCIAIVPDHPQYVVIGTYSLSAASDTPQTKRGSLQIHTYSPDGDRDVELDRLDFDFGIYDLQFHPLHHEWLGAATSHGEIRFYAVTSHYDEVTDELHSLKLTYYWHVPIEPHSDNGNQAIITFFQFLETEIGRLPSLVTTTQFGNTRLVKAPIAGATPDLSQNIVIHKQSMELEAWTTVAVVDTITNQILILSGGDDSQLIISSIALSGGSYTEADARLDLTRLSPQKLLADRRNHSAGVVAICWLGRHPSHAMGEGTDVQDTPAQSPPYLFLTGSYDEHLRLFLLPSPSLHDQKSRLETIGTIHLEGGVWRIILLDTYTTEVLVTNYILLIAGHATGAFVVRLTCKRGLDDDWEYAFKVEKQFTEHESLVYAVVAKKDELVHGKWDVISTSFYDKKICNWGWVDEEKE
ncbi:glutamate--cysteine ligase [Lithohypha guttulata]|uniref:glutamate--cysteine ligase n=1 Tax=Lithohypha guttulata TaxID=1690604 RepID=UPI00315DB69A